MPKNNTNNNQDKDYKKIHRSLTDRHVVQFELDCTVEVEHALINICDGLRKIGNEMTYSINKNYEQLTRTNKYKELIKSYGELKEKLKKLNEADPKYIKLEKQRKQLAKELNDLHQKYKITKTDLRKYSEDLSNNKLQYEKLNSIFVLSKFEDVWQSVESVLYGDGEYVHYHKKNDLPIIRAKQINRGITFDVDNKNKLIVNIGQAIGHKKLITKLKPIDKKDFFLQEELEEIIKYIKNPEIEEFFINEFIKTGEVQNTFRPCYAQIKCEKIRNKNRFFIQFVMEGTPKQKKNRQGQQRHHFKKGVVGVDVGPQTVASVSEEVVHMTNLAERNNKSSRDTEYKIQNIQRKMDRSRRSTNPQNHNDDGTVKKGSKDWYKSNNYKKLEYQLKNHQRKAALTRKYAIQELVNNLREQGDILITEKNNINALKRRSNKTERSEKTITKKTRDGRIVQVKKFKKKKRFGKSIQHRCPGFFISDCKKKFNQYKEVDSMFRASQYDHKLNDYIKKQFSDRKHTFNDGTIVQRDIYSAFLLYCSNLIYTEPDKYKCDLYFDEFYKKYLEFDDKVEKENIKICNYK